MKKFVTTMIGLTAGGSALIFAGCGQDEQEYREPTVQTNEQRESDAMAVQRGNNLNHSEQERQGTTRTAEGDEPVNIALYEEELDVQKREVPAGGVVIRKDVETEPAEESVELRHETIEVTRLSPEEAEQRQQQVARDDQPFTEDEVFIPLAKEEAVPEREAQVREVVRAERGVDRSQETVEEDVRREVVDYEDRSQEEARQQGQSAERSNAQMAATSGQQSANQQNQQRSQPQELEQRVERELAQALPQDQFERIDISVDERTVALGGTVNDEETARGVEDYVSGIEGVENVENRLQIAQR